MVLAVVVLYAIVDPAAALFPKCPIKAVTGFDCPGCGSQRAFHALLHGDLAAAWRLNAALFFAVPLIAIYFSASALKSKAPGLYAALSSRTAVAAIAVATVAWWIMRNL